MPFILTTCAVGAEAVLRRCMLEQRGWRAAFSRPGLLTWKVDEPFTADLVRPHPLFRIWGLSLGFCSAPKTESGPAAKLAARITAAAIFNLFIIIV